MLTRKELIEGMDSKYEPMLSLVNIANFTKCIAQLSGLQIKEVDDSVIKEYLRTWARNKYKYFEMLGNKLQLDNPIEYEQLEYNKREEYNIIRNQFPGFLYWINIFRNATTNKIDLFSIRWDERDMISELFPNEHVGGMSITHFFKRCLNAPDELVTAIGRIYENDRIKGTHTISIDPVDMMLASENPYKWQSCYRLAVPNDSSHADGCLAAVLDDSSLITYIWSNEGKFSIYGNYEFKSIRYKKMREWISISPSMGAIHFNAIYPGRDLYPKEFRKQWRDVIETTVANYIGAENMWSKPDSGTHYCEREYPYGYGEYKNHNIYVLKEVSQQEDWNVFNEEIICPCGCGHFIPGSDFEELNQDIGYNYDYDGRGFLYENFNYEEDEPEYYCDYSDSYCSHDCNSEECRFCHYWRENHPVCSLDNDTECPTYDSNDEDDQREIRNGIISALEDHCQGCPLYNSHNCSQAIEHNNLTESNIIDSRDIDNRQLCTTIESVSDEGITLTTSYYGNNSITINSPNLFDENMIISTTYPNISVREWLDQVSIRDRSDE